MVEKKKDFFEDFNKKEKIKNQGKQGIGLPNPLGETKELQNKKESAKSVERKQVVDPDLVKIEEKKQSNQTIILNLTQDCKQTDTLQKENDPQKKSDAVELKQKKDKNPDLASFENWANSTKKNLKADLWKE